MSLWQANADYLKRKHPALWTRLPKQPKPETYQIVSAKRDGLTLLVNQVPVHSKYHPLKEACALVEAAHQHAPKDAFAFHFGLGLGYALEAEPEDEERPLVVFEPCLDFFAEAVHVRAFEPLLETRNVRLCFDLESLRLALRALGDLRYTNLYPVILPFHRRAFDEVYKQAMVIVAEEAERHKVRRKTLTHVYPRAVLSTLRSLPHALRTPSAAHLMPLLAGKPAIVIAAGPSLERSIAYLRSLQERAVLITVARCLKTLLAHGVVPHFFVQNEAQDYREFILETHLPNTHALLADQCHRLFHDYPKAASWGYSHLANSVTRWMEMRFPATRKLHVDTGGSVANDAFSLAVAVGCNPVILVGQDLAFQDGQIYADEARNPNFEFNPELEVKVTGYWGKPVPSSVHYRPCIRWYAEAAQFYQQQVPTLQFINATAGGVRLEGFQQRALAALAYELPHLPQLRSELAAFALKSESFCANTPLSSLYEQLLGQCEAVEEAIGVAEQQLTGLAERLQHWREAKIKDVAFRDHCAEGFEDHLQTLQRLLHIAPVPASMATWLREPPHLPDEEAEMEIMLGEHGQALQQFARQVAAVRQTIERWLW